MSSQTNQSWHVALVATLLLLACARKSSTGTANPQSAPSLGQSPPTTDVRAASSSPRAPTNRTARKRELEGVIDDNVGHAHFTRGMNMQTIEALRKATTLADLPVLEAIASDDDRVAAREVGQLFQLGRQRVSRHLPTRMQPLTGLRRAAAV